MSRGPGLLVCGGGTGGHLFPGIAVAEAWQRRYPQGRVLFVVTGRRVETAPLEERQLPTAVVSAAGVKGLGAGGLARALVTVPRGVVQALGVIRTFRPDVVLGVGGYGAVPVVVAARLRRVPVYLHEQNSVPGLANRLLARFARRVFLSLADVDRRFPAGRTVLVGNPLRREIVVAAGGPRPATGCTLAVLGGSQGAHRLNELVPQGLALVRDDLPADFRVIHQTGTVDEDMVRQAYGQYNIPAEVAPFFHDMARVYTAAHLVVARAGATTLAELTACGLPAILVPFPYAADGHQEKNARYLVDHGAARMFVEAATTPATLGRAVADLANDPETIKKMAEASRRLARLDAAETMVTMMHQDTT